MPSPNEITVAQLSRLIGTPDAPVIIDVRVDEDFILDPRLIPTARRHRFDDVTSLVPELVGKSVVITCQKGKKLSAGSAAVLRAQGIKAEYLLGGHLAWSAAKEMAVPVAAIPARPNGHTVWVTRQRPKIDRIACPWLIRRFVDPNAQFLFVPPTEIDGVAEHFNATPFDVADGFWSHRGEGCTFDTMLGEFALKSDALSHLAVIVRGADTDQLNLAPECPGLLAASLGLSRMYRDDLEQLEAGMTLYDSFYRWARDATDETHKTPFGQV